jgi:hypothetical protein
MQAPFEYLPMNDEPPQGGFVVLCIYQTTLPLKYSTHLPRTAWAMAKQAEAEREGSTKVIAADENFRLHNVCLMQ